MNWLFHFFTEKTLLRHHNQQLVETNAALEEENAILRSDIRSLVNSSLSQAGVAPLPASDEPIKPIQRIRRPSFHQMRRTNEARQDYARSQEAAELHKTFKGAS